LLESSAVVAWHGVAMKRPTGGDRLHACTRKRRYRTQGDALDAAMVAGVERGRTAYQCPQCGQWHLATKPGRR
jgi:hypothetical protein